MAFNYDLASPDSDILAISRVRLEIGDADEGAGVKRDGSNLSDEELSYFLDEEGAHVGRAAARAAEVLARHWAIVATLTLGPRKEEFGEIADRWARRAAELRAQHGGGASGSFCITPRRADGYSATGSEYAP